MRLFCSVTLLVLSATVVGQRLKFENYTSEQGLSQNTCYTIAQDGNGFMWFGTQDGLNRYDGRKFKTYSQLNEIGKNLPGNIISSLFYDVNKSLLWVGTIQGACIYDSQLDSLLKVSDIFPFASQLDRVPIKKIISFKKGEYWIVTFNNGLLCLNTVTSKIQSFFTDEENKANVTSIELHQGKIYVSLLYSMYRLLPSGSNYSVTAFHPGYPFPQIRELYSYNNALWIGTMTGGCYYIKDPVEQEESITQLPIALGGVGGFVKDNYNNLWIGTRGSGIYRFDPRTNSVVIALHNEYDPSTPCSNYALSIFKDRQGIIWTGFYAGITKYDPLRFQFNNIDENSSLHGSLNDRVIVKIYRCRNGSTFVGTLNKGILKWNRSNNEFMHYPGSEMVNTAPNVVYDITEDDRGEVWAASCGGLMHVDQNTSKIKYYSEKKLPELNKLYALIKLKKADSLLIASENGLRFFSLKDKKWLTLPASLKVTTFMGGLYVYSGRHIYEDENNILWICSEGSGLLWYDYLHSRFGTVEPVNKISLFIRHLMREGDVFWLPTDNGLIIYDWKRNKVIKHLIINADGSNVCYAAQKDDKGYYWVSTNSGFCKINSEYQIIQRFNTGNGLPFLEYNTACVLKDTNGILTFGGMGGITYFNPSHLEDNPFSPKPIITAIKVNDQSWPLHLNPDLANELRFDHKQNFLTIEFAVNNFSNEANNLFSYRLKGLNNTWSTPGPGTVASFTSVPPGDYVFELKSANSDGKWSGSIKSLAITILPAFWQTWWFQAIAIIFVAVLAYWFTRRRIRSIRQESLLQQQLAELEIKGLHAQMNPHFIFNCLNSIKEMILNDQKQNASRYLTKFANLIRTGLDHSRQTFITVEQCVDHLKQYLEMEKLRFDDFSYDVVVDESLRGEDTRIAPMLVQPLVENAIWHGLRNKEKDRALVVRFFKEKNHLICEIEDNGVGMRHTLNTKAGSLATHRSLGIANIQERLTVLNEKYHMNCSLRINDKMDLPAKESGGTLAVLQLTI